MGREFWPNGLAFATVLGPDSVMGKFLRWISASALAAVCLWELGHSGQTISPVLIGALLLGLGVLIGLRIGSDSALNFVGDLNRVNKVLAEQNRDLAELNLSYLKDRISDEPGALGSSAVED